MFKLIFVMELGYDNDGINVDSGLACIAMNVALLILVKMSANFEERGSRT